MMTAEQARCETNKYTETPFDFKQEEFNKFTERYKCDLIKLDKSIIEAAKRQEYKTSFSIYFDDINVITYFSIPINDTPQFIYHLYKTNKIEILIKYLNNNGYKAVCSDIYKKKMLSTTISLGFNFEISWEK